MRFIVGETVRPMTERPLSLTEQTRKSKAYLSEMRLFATGQIDTTEDVSLHSSAQLYEDD